jgi:uncharacterized sodium:solute symporter family permease YidK
LPITIKNLKKDRISFKNNLVSYLLNNSFYTVAEFLEHKLNNQFTVIVKLCCIAFLALCVLFVLKYCDQFRVHYIWT